MRTPAPCSWCWRAGVQIGNEKWFLCSGSRIFHVGLVSIFALVLFAALTAVEVKRRQILYESTYIFTHLSQHNIMLQIAIRMISGTVINQDEEHCQHLFVKWCQVKEVKYQNDLGWITSVCLGQSWPILDWDLLDPNGPWCHVQDTWAIVRLLDNWGHLNFFSNLHRCIKADYFLKTP